MRLASLLSGFLLLSASGATFADGIDEPIPSFYQEPGLSQNREYLDSNANEQIDPFTGKLQWHYVDLTIPGNGGLSFNLQRSYSSHNETIGEDSAFGMGWTMHFGRILRNQAISICDTSQPASKNPVLELPDGSRHIMYGAPDNVSFITSARWKGVCNTGPAGGLLVFSPAGVRYEMTELGPLVGSAPATKQRTYYTSKITDRFGNWMAFTYATLPGGTFGPSAVTTSDGRNVTFTYEGSLIKTIASGNRSWTYGFTAIPGYAGIQYQLTLVTRPDGTQWQYEYNPPGTGPGTGTPGGFSMKKVTYPTGGTFEYTYAFQTFNALLPPSTVVSQKTGAIGTWSYAYRPATQQIDTPTVTIDPSLDSPKLDKTTVTGPEGTTLYYHVGYNSAPSGLVYLIGSLVGKSSVGVENESYSWSGQTISAQANLRPPGTLVFDPETKAPLMIGKGINRNGQAYTIAFNNFDEFGNPGSMTEAGTDSRTTTFTYFIDTDRWIIRQRKDETVSTIGSVVRNFFSNGSLQSETRYGVTTSYTYSAEGDVQTKVDANGNQSQFGGYKRGIPQTESHPEGVTIGRSVSDVGDITSETDGEGSTVGYSYDGLGRVTSISRQIGNPISVDWTATTRTVHRGGYQEVLTLDAYGRPSQVVHSQNGENVTQLYRHDALGRRTFVSYPNDTKGTGYFYDMIGQTLAIQHEFDPDGQTATSGRAFFYANNTVKLTNERGFDTLYTYRAYGDPEKRDLMSIAAPEANTSITMQRNGLGQVTQVVQDSVTRGFSYDSHFYLTGTTDPEIGSTTFGRDGVGNMTSRQVSGGPSVTFEYDGRNRQKTISYPVGTPSVTKAYFKDDKPKSVGSSVVTRDFTYDANKNLKTETLTIAGGLPETTQYDYDGNDALDKVTYASGSTVTYAPDGFGRPTKAAPYVTAVTHHPTGEPASITYANGMTTTVAINGRKLPSRLSITRDGSPFVNSAYEYDGIGNIYSISDDADSRFSRSMDYDKVDRLTVANGPWGLGQIQYDGRGNITQQVMGGSILNYNYTSERLTSITGTKPYTFTYDGEGNVTGNGSTTFSYDAAPNMRCSNCGAGETTYDYDGSNIRVRSTKDGVSTVYFQGANGSLLWEESPTVRREYFYLHGRQIAVRQQLAQ